MTRPGASSPSAWRKHVHPRRDRPSASFTKVKLDKKASNKLAAHLASIRDGLHVEAANELRAKSILGAVDVQISGGEIKDPNLAGAIGSLARYRIQYEAKPQPNALVDQWVLSHGLPFAVDAALHSLSFSVGVNERWMPGKAVLAEMNHEASAVSFDAPMYFHIANDARPTLFRLRSMLATCPEDEHDEAKSKASAHRTKDLSLVGFMRRVATSCLFSGVSPWVAEDVAAFGAEFDRYEDSETRSWRPPHLTLLMASLTRLSEFETLNDVRREYWPESPWDLRVAASSIQGDRSKRFRYLPTMLEGMGAELLPLCTYLYDYNEKADYAMAMGAIPTDEAMKALIERADTKHAMSALTTAVQHFPERASRLVGDHVKSRRRHWKKLESLLTQGVGSKAKADPKIAQKRAEPEDVPLLYNPPWKSGPSRKFKAIDVEPIVYEASFEWEKGEQDAFWSEWDDSDLQPGGYLEVLQKGSWAPKEPWQEWNEEQWRELTTDWETRFRVARGPEYLSVELAEANAANDEYFYDMRTAIARHEDRFLAVLLTQAKRYPKDACVHLGPFDCAELAMPLASIVHVKKTKEDVERWFVRHPRATAAGLIPAALGKNAKSRKAAIAALKVAARNDLDSVLEIAESRGPEVGSAVRRILGDDPRFSSRPNIPAFWTGALSSPVLKDGSAISAEAFTNLGIFLMLSETNNPLPGLNKVLAAFDKESLAEFGRALFEMWGLAGYANEHKWVMSAQGFVGDDTTTRMLTPLVRRWPGEGAHVRATLGLEALASIGTDLALMGIHDIGQRLKFKALKVAAQKMVKNIAQERGLSEEELADRLVPTLGLDARGMVELDFGARVFTLRFDESLKVHIRDDQGKTLKTLPKPRKSDDLVKAKEAKRGFTALKKDLRAIAGSQITRLERAMIVGRRWSKDAFEMFFAQHPLMRHLARRIVWACYDKHGNIVATFWPTDEGLMDVSEQPFVLGPNDQVGIPHPIDIPPADRLTWDKTFADYEILQPFAQLGRPVYDSAAALFLLLGIREHVVSTTLILGLIEQGWTRGAPQDSGHIGVINRNGTDTMRLEFEPGFSVERPAEIHEQTLRGVFVGADQVGESELQAFSAIERSELAMSLGSLI